MLFTIDKTTIDTDTDCSSEERHILQKMLCWKIYTTSVDEFREKVDQAFKLGWNDSGSVKRSRVMEMLIDQMEEEVRQRTAKSTE